MGSRLCLRKRCQAGGLQDVHQPAPQISVRQCIAQGLLLSATWVLMVVITKVKIALIYSVFQRKWPAHRYEATGMHQWGAVQDGALDCHEGGSRPEDHDNHSTWAATRPPVSLRCFVSKASECNERDRPTTSLHRRQGPQNRTRCTVRGFPAVAGLNRLRRQTSAKTTI